MTNTSTQSTKRWPPRYGAKLYRMGSQTQNLQVTLSRRRRSDAMLQHTLVMDYNFHYIYFSAAPARLRRLYHLVCSHDLLQPAQATTESDSDGNLHHDSGGRSSCAGEQQPPSRTDSVKTLCYDVEDYESLDSFSLPEDRSLGRRPF